MHTNTLAAQISGESSGHHVQNYIISIRWRRRQALLVIGATRLAGSRHNESRPSSWRIRIDTPEKLLVRKLLSFQLNAG
jgi:hypothetical protein